MTTKATLNDHPTYLTREKAEELAAINGRDDPGWIYTAVSRPTGRWVVEVWDKYDGYLGVL